ncbi:MAG: amino acid permease [Sedimentisphaerales bacterium]|nr:amino acid permease [Sedimentisphaerales bacterium]
MTQLKKQLGLLDVFSIAAGAMISSGLFVLPAIAYSKAGPAAILSYAIASFIILPTALSKAELSTAMPCAGGTYFFVERSLGPMIGLFTGFAGWFSLALKSAFAVVGMAVLIEVLFSNFLNIALGQIALKEISILCCLIFTAMNIVSVKHTGRFQSLLVAVLLIILAFFVFTGMPHIKATKFDGFFDTSWRTTLATAGLVFISYGGLTKVASIAEEVKDPGRNLTLGMILAWFVVSVFYILVIIVTVGVTTDVELRASLTPVSLAASKFMPTFGFALLAIAAIAAFITTANGGILTASRSPMSMSRDKLLPKVLAKVNRRFRTPHISILLTAGFMICSIVFLEIELLVKTASTLMIILFILDNVSVIVMRESRIQAYRPQFRCPLYPYLQIVAIIAYSALLIDMGRIPLSICGLFIVGSGAWYLLYVQKRVTRASAVMHLVERITDRQLKTVTLEDELRDILIERDQIIKDRFDKLIRDCRILDLKETCDAEEVFRQVAEILAPRIDENKYVLLEKLLAREADTTTVVQPGLAIPHIVVEGENKFDVVLVRAFDGVKFPKSDTPVKTMFFLAGSKDERNYHLRALMAIAQIAQEKDFEKSWLAARDTEGIRNLILMSARKRDTAN